MKELLNFIDGEFQRPVGGAFLPSYDPARGEVHLQMADSDERDVRLAVAAAQRAFPAWARRPAAERAKILYKIADRIDARLDAFAEAESRDQGKPVWLAREMDIPRAAHNFRFFAGAVLHSEESATFPNPGLMNYVVHEPVGVAGLISPWNLPLYLLTWKIGPALAFGNTAVCKPSELTSLTAHMLCEVAVEAGLPAGVLNMIFGTGPRAGHALVSHPDVPLVSFTGGTATGKLIAQTAAPMFKKLSLELGGKNPALIFNDCDLEAAVKGTIRSSFLNQGEICLCGSRIYVQRGVYDEFMKRFVSAARDLKVGDPLDPSTFIGALVSKEHLEKVEGFIRHAREEGARIHVGGERLEGPGYFLRPTVISGVAHDSRVQQEEIFGPVVTVTPFDDEAEAFRMANGVRYGLSATVWTQNLARAHRAARELEAGTVWVNTWMSRDLRVPFGGVKASGVGREGQNESREFFTEAKTVCIQHG